MGRFHQQKRPQIHLANPLTRQLLFAVPCAWDRGLAWPTNVTRNTIRAPTAGDAMGTINPAILATILDFGYGLCSSTDGWFSYEADLGVSIFIGGAGFSCAALVRPTVVPPVGTTNRRVFQKRASGAATSPGFDMFLDTFIAHTWSFEWSDGVTEQTLRSTSVPNVERSDLLVGTLDPQTSVARFYVNGICEVEAALGVTPVNPVGQPIGICGGIGPAGDEGGNNCVGMAALWNRVLNPREVNDLWADPFRMWH